MGWLRFALGLMSLLFTVSASAAQAGNPVGRWALHADGQTLMILELSRDPAFAEGLSGQLIRPERMELSGTRAPGSHSFSAIEGAIVRRRIHDAALRGGDHVFRIDGRRAGQSDEYVFRVASDGSGELTLSGAPVAPFVFVRASAGEAVAQRWNPERTYRVDWERLSNPQMTAIFEADQKSRLVLGAPIDWTVKQREDRERRAETKALLDSGKLQSGEDFYHAAFVFQHGDMPADFLLAHTLATIAMARGNRSASWIAAATLDRFLQNIGQKQVFGTQFGKANTQEPFDRTLLSDDLRTAMGVPVLKEQEEDRVARTKQAAELAARSRNN